MLACGVNPVPGPTWMRIILRLVEKFTQGDIHTGGGRPGGVPYRASLALGVAAALLLSGCAWPHEDIPSGGELAFLVCALIVIWPFYVVARMVLDALFSEITFRGILVISGILLVALIVGLMVLHARLPATG
jgi:hypothetical protein